MAHVPLHVAAGPEGPADPGPRPAEAAGGPAAPRRQDASPDAFGGTGPSAGWSPALASVPLARGTAGSREGVMAVRLAAPAERGRFDAFVVAHPRGNPLQRWSWGEVKRGDGWEPLRVVVERGGEIAATASVVERRLGAGARLWLCHRGPVCAPDAPEASLLWTGLRRLALRRGCLAMRCDPEWPPEEGAHLRRAGLLPLPPRQDWLFGALEPLRVWRISLEGGAEAALGRCAAHTRRDLRRAARLGVEVAPGTRADVDTLHGLLAATAARRGFPLRSAGFFHRLWRAWDAQGEGQIFTARCGGRVVGAAWVAVCGAGCWLHFLAVDWESRRLLPAAALCWAGIRHAIERGCRFYDFGGIAHRGGLDDGQRAFKAGFGPGDTRFAGEHDLVFRPGWYRLFRLAEEARWAWCGRPRRRRPRLPAA